MHACALCSLQWAIWMNRRLYKIGEHGKFTDVQICERGKQRVNLFENTFWIFIPNDPIWAPWGMLAPISLSSHIIAASSHTMGVRAHSGEEKDWKNLKYQCCVRVHVVKSESESESESESSSQSPSPRVRVKNLVRFTNLILHI